MPATPPKQRPASPAVAVQQGARQVVIDDAHAGQRVDNWLARELRGVPKARIYQMLRKGEVRVNGGRVKPPRRLAAGDILRIPPARALEPKPVQVADGLADHLTAAVLYEDDRLLVVNKPAGLAVHGGSGLSIGLIEALRAMRPAAPMLELVHRLDRDTSGCVMVAKKRSALRQLHAALREHQVDKRYQALVHGRWGRRGVVDAPLLRITTASGERMVRVHPDGKPSRTRVAVAASGDSVTLVDCWPESGRTHQLRVHLAHSGHAIVGDPKYADDQQQAAAANRGVHRLCLHAAGLDLQLDGTALAVRAPLPDSFTAALAAYRVSPADGPDPAATDQHRQP